MSVSLSGLSTQDLWHESQGNKPYFRSVQARDAVTAAGVKLEPLPHGVYCVPFQCKGGGISKTSLSKFTAVDRAGLDCFRCFSLCVVCCSGLFLATPGSHVAVSPRRNRPADCAADIDAVPQA